MNKRIKELAEQAGYKPLSPPTFADELNEIFMKKFAELIVRECGVALRPMLRDMISRGHAYDLIREHFGVEHEDI